MSLLCALCCVCAIQLSDLFFDFPVVHPGKVGLPSRYVYGAILEYPSHSPYMSGIAKVSCSEHALHTLRPADAPGHEHAVLLEITSSSRCVVFMCSQFDLTMPRGQDACVAVIPYPAECAGGEALFVPRKSDSQWGTAGGCLEFVSIELHGWAAWRACR